MRQSNQRSRPRRTTVPPARSAPSARPAPLGRDEGRRAALDHDEGRRAALDHDEGRRAALARTDLSGPVEQAPAVDDVGATAAFETPATDRTAPELRRRFRITVVEGPGVGRVCETRTDRCAIGSHPLNDLVVDDPTVSRFHCEVRVTDAGTIVTDLKSKNGTVVDGVRVNEAFLRGGSLLRVGRLVARFDYTTDCDPVLVARRARFGSLIGGSRAMRSTFALLERAAASDLTVLLEGATGTGKGKAAEAIHRESARRAAPFMVVDCGSIPANLLESELFGHEKGAFTGAEARRIGVFEEASGGTLFLDEIGELPRDLQPKLLRVLENREFRRIGANRFQPLDVRIVAATNRDLRAEVNAGNFRSDLYYRLAVLKIPMPSLRDRPDDIPAIVDEMLRAVGAGEEARARLLAPDVMADLQRAAWPGNVRELRNFVERTVVVADPALGHATIPPPATTMGAGADDRLPYGEAKRRAVADWERRYLEGVLARADGKVARAAALAGLDRVYLYRLLRRAGLKPA